MMKLIDRLLELDSGLLLYLNNLGTPSWDAFWFAVTHKLTFVPLYMFLLFLMSKNMTKRAVLLLVVSLASMITFTDQITNLFKSGFQRLRPCAQEGIVELLRLGDCSGYGFFSGHSSNSMAAAIFTILMLSHINTTVSYHNTPWNH